MPSPNSITPEKLARLIGTPGCPVIVDVACGSVPGAIHRPAEEVGRWAKALVGRPAVVVCTHGQEKSAGAAAWLRHAGVDAEILEGGASAWSAAGLPTLDKAKLPPRDPEGRTIWVTRARPKVDRIACPWLIRRFVDPEAVFLFVAPGEVAGVAKRFGATPFDVEGVQWSHSGDLCTFDVMVEELGSSGFEGLGRLAPIVRGADTGRPDLAPQAAGLLAASLGLSRMFADDLEQLDAA